MLKSKQVENQRMGRRGIAMPSRTDKMAPVWRRAGPTCPGCQKMQVARVLPKKFTCNSRQVRIAQNLPIKSLNLYQWAQARSSRLFKRRLRLANISQPTKLSAKIAKMSLYSNLSSISTTRKSQRCTRWKVDIKCLQTNSKWLMAAKIL